MSKVRSFWRLLSRDFRAKYARKHFAAASISCLSPVYPCPMRKVSRASSKFLNMLTTSAMIKLGKVYGNGKARGIRGAEGLGQEDMGV